MQNFYFTYRTLKCRRFTETIKTHEEKQSSLDETKEA